MSGLQLNLQALSFYDPSNGISTDVTSQVLEHLSRAFPGSLTVHADVFTGSGGGAQRMCKELGLALLGKVPLDPALVLAAEEGRSILADQATANSPSALALQAIVRQVLVNTSNKAENGVSMDHT